MPKYTLKVPELNNLPWQDKPANCKSPVWRYSANPIIRRDATANSNSIFNSAVVPFKGKFAGVFRVDDKVRSMNIHRGFSDDGINWKIDDAPIQFKADPKLKDLPASDYKYDPRVIWVDDRWYIIWCNGYHGACLGAGYTFDFETFYQLENVFHPYNRNGVLFPRKIDGNFAILHRPSDSGHTPFGDIFYSVSPDMEFWGKHRHVMSPGWSSGWQSTKIGAGATPIETSEGWLLIYHGVLTSCNGFVYSMGVALLDINEPWKVKYRSKPYLLNPTEPYELMGDVPNVTFPCASLQDSKTGRIAIYYGCADTHVGMAFGYTDEIIDWLKANSL